MKKVDLKNKNVLVTGAGGFVGSHLVESLLAEKANVRAFVRYNSANSHGFLDTIVKEEEKRLQIYSGDLKDALAVRRAMEGIELVFHLGALIAIPYSYKNPQDVMETNIIGTLNVANAALDGEVKRLVHTSTSETYGTARYVPMDETHPLQGQSPYSASKISADKIIESYNCSYDLPAVTIRPFNAYGPRQSMRAVIPTIIQQALRSKEIVLGNLHATRDFTFVEDTARAFICAAKADRGIGEVINAGSGFEVSIGEIAEKVLKVIGKKIPIRVAEDRIRPEKSEVDRLFSDSQKAERLIGWKAEVSFEEGLRKTITWMEANQHLYRPDEYVL
ncbi:SDR family NAD(P)-dependent oxidoreductase [Mechercharimyces sp. CAU 1602]|uniref:SDR family NAD(P)-dependent oxidoreductase n=1 Tax=Mechercharimyces sp. CAU 1602 TaxID=2973933 RepID=UPI00216114AF|nr:SDR family NAD(P)-dependent oxidoreductase [Mechercharimyces sp. CAU 1602]MCS1350156.1 SDR family NAD(P)-dependent oxidoreductase [Mechercharimyces sp. CAU 1602]